MQLSDIQWKLGAVCFALDHQWMPGDKVPKGDTGELIDVELSDFICAKDFQINEIRNGDYISPSEINSEKDYIDIIEVLECLGFVAHANHKGYCRGTTNYLVLDNGSYDYLYGITGRRVVTFKQLMSVGKLKRTMAGSDTFLGHPTYTFVCAIERVKVLEQVGCKHSCI